METTRNLSNAHVLMAVHQISTISETNLHLETDWEHQYEDS
jgi:hypothetical protein